MFKPFRASAALFAGLSLTACIGVPIEQPNKAPIADAGANITAVTYEKITLDASASRDPEGKPLKYSWRAMDNDLKPIAGTTWNSQQISFYLSPFFTNSDGNVYTFELTVTDDQGLTATKQVTITQQPQSYSQDLGDLFSDTLGWSNLAVGFELNVKTNQGQATLDGYPINPNIPGGDYLKWSVLDTHSPSHGKVIDLQFGNDANIQGFLDFQTETGYPQDLRAYAGGFVEFDIRVLDYAATTHGIAVKMDCHWPCGSKDLPVPLAPGNQWQHVSMPINDFVAAGLDLQRVNVVFAIFPSWLDQAGVHMQIDNVHWILPPGATAPIQPILHLSESALLGSPAASGVSRPPYGEDDYIGYYSVDNGSLSKVTWHQDYKGTDVTQQDLVVNFKDVQYKPHLGIDITPWGDLTPYANQDLTLDVKLDNATTSDLKISLRNNATNNWLEADVTKTITSSNNWQTLHIPLQAFNSLGLDLANVIDLRIAANSPATVHLRNIRISDPSKQPKADAGADVQIIGRGLVSLNAGQSSSPDGAALNYLWQQISGPIIDVANQDAWQNPVLNFTAPAINSQEPLVFSLTVSDANGNTATDTVTVNRTATCSQQDGVLFENCLDNAWSNYAGYNQVAAPFSEDFYTSSDPSKHIYWQEVDSQDPVHQRVIDVKFGDDPTRNGIFYIAPYHGQQDMRAYTGGTIEFDVRVLDYGLNTKGVVTKIECGYPCQSQEIPLNLAPGHDWQHIVLHVDDLVSQGLDLSKTTFGFEVMAPWFDQTGLHLQVDNIRWVKPVIDYGCVAVNCSKPQWGAYQGFEQPSDLSSYDIFVDGQSGHHLSWSNTSTNDAQFASVIDLNFDTRPNLNSIFYVQGNANGYPKDLSGYANGNVEFDVRILDYGANTSGIFTKLECVWPCESATFKLNLQPGDQWQHISIPVSEFTSTGLDLKRVKYGFEIFPQWNEQEGVHMQVSNIRWTLAQGETPLTPPQLTESGFLQLGEPATQGFGSFVYATDDYLGFYTISNGEQAQVQWNLDAQKLNAKFASNTKIGVLHVALNTWGNDLTAHQAEDLSFDLNSADYAQNAGLEIALVSCKINICNPYKISLGKIGGAQKTKITIPLSQFISAGLDITQVFGLDIAPAPLNQGGVTLEVSNIHLEPHQTTSRF